MDAGALGAAQERPDVVRILERVEDEDERRFAALGGPGEDIVDRREPSRLHDEGDALVAIEAGEGRERPALDLDDRDPQARGVQDDPLERLAALRDDQQPTGRPSRDERFLDRPTAGDEFLIGSEGIRRRQAGSARAGRAAVRQFGPGRNGGRGPRSGPGRAGPGPDGGRGRTADVARTGSGLVRRSGRAAGVAAGRLARPGAGRGG